MKMTACNRRSLPITILALALFALALPAAAATAPAPEPPPPPCEEFSDGTHLRLPPGCTYYTTNFKYLLPPDQVKALKAKPIHRFFICGGDRVNTNSDDCREPGGDLGGDVEVFTSEVVLEVHGEGDLADFRRTVTIPNVAVEVHTSEQVPGASTQSLQAEMKRIQGCLPPGDPDFQELCVVGGSDNGFESPGITTGTYDSERGVWVIDSSFDVGYTIHFAGAPGGRLAGHAGETTAVTTMTAGADDACP